MKGQTMNKKPPRIDELWRKAQEEQRFRQPEKQHKLTPEQKQTLIDQAIPCFIEGLRLREIRRGQQWWRITLRVLPEAFRKAKDTLPGPILVLELRDDAKRHKVFSTIQDALPYGPTVLTTDASAPGHPYYLLVDAK